MFEILRDFFLRKKIVEKAQDAAHSVDWNKWRGKDDDCNEDFLIFYIKKIINSLVL